jgi:hypothetical protein
MQKIMSPDGRAKKMARSTGLMTTKIDGESSCCLIHKNHLHATNQQRYETIFLSFSLCQLYNSIIRVATKNKEEMK